jgi:hypothetical protein
MRRTLFKTVIPPANLPGPIAIVSPSPAASSAAWIVKKHPALALTHNVDAERAGAVAAAHTIATTTVAAAREMARRMSGPLRFVDYRAGRYAEAPRPSSMISLISAKIGGITE